MSILIEAVTKQFGDFLAVDQVSLEIKTGSLVALLGPSGSGKSTLLRIIAGLEKPDAGRIFLTEQDATAIDVKDRQIGFVFQHYALFKHLTVRRNIAFGLEVAKWNQKRIQQRVDELLELIQLTGLGDRYPSQLSGGQRQRVALARALALQPKVLLLDEPFGALDAKVRKELRSWLRHLHKEVQVTTVFVTHDQEEAMEVADELVIMNRGRVEQVGAPADIYDRPASPFVMSFIGPVNVLASNPQIVGRSAHSEATQVFLRPHDIEVEVRPEPGRVPAKVNRVIHLGWEVRVELGLQNQEKLNVHLEREDFDRLNLQPQQEVYIQAKQDRVLAFDRTDNELANGNRH
uniref:ABC-type quaternary amine transporter n=1 Tax=Cyanothece sp. (strain PCC 7425 / ATCC 29141) TaxID=395961 RepID=B8HKV2_CYAP4